MRILYVVPVNLRHETAQILEYKKLGIDTYVVSGRVETSLDKLLVDANIPIDIVPMRKRIDNEAIKQIRKIITDRNIDIVHAFNNITVTNAIQACKGLDVKFIAYRGIVGNVSFFNPTSWLTYLNSRVDRIICVAEAIRQHLLNLKFLWLKIPAKKLVTIHKGHHIHWYNKDPADLSVFNIPENAFTVGCVANYRPRKGIEVLVDAWQHIPEKLNIHLLLIGNMSHPHLTKHIKKSSVADRVHLSGYVENAPEVLAACDACVLPSLRREGLPRGVIEGMAYSVPPIVTNSGGSPELITDGVDGLIVEPGSAKALAKAVLKYYRNPDFRKQLGAAAKSKIEQKFTVANTVKQTYALYEELYGELNRS